MSNRWVPPNERTFRPAFGCDGGGAAPTDRRCTSRFTCTALNSIGGPRVPGWSNLSCKRRPLGASRVGRRAGPSAARASSDACLCTCARAGGRECQAGTRGARVGKCLIVVNDLLGQLGLRQGKAKHVSVVPAWTYGWYNGRYGYRGGTAGKVGGTDGTAGTGVLSHARARVLYACARTSSPGRRNQLCTKTVMALRKRLA